MTHDPLCPWRPYEQVRHTRQFLPCQCDIIAKVREDERRERVMLKEALEYYKAPVTQAVRKGWHEGVSDCIAAAEDQHMYMSSHSQIVVGFDVAKSEILRALRALREVDTP